MARFVKGDIVVLPFPFSDFSQEKRRPALVLASFENGDCILSQITSQPVKDQYAVPVRDEDFTEGSLRHASNVRPNRLFTANSEIVLYRAGRLKSEKTCEVIAHVVQILKENP